jgi:sterol desaturase/sphingolipid hydroxylase (fatty acid hydroxylase superfamily)
MSSFEVITTSILLVWMALIVVLEQKFPYKKGIPILREGFWTDLIWYTLIQSYFLKIIIFDYIILPVDHRYHLSFDLLNNIPLWGQVIFFLVIHDFYIYWFHRWQHSSKILWRTHEAHHSNKEVDWLAGSRSHSLEIIINQTVEFLPIVLLGANPLVVPLKALLDAVWGMYIHSNINIKAGKLQYIINGPQMHQWHHANDRKVFHANFATKLALWDWLFGTGYLPEHKPDEFGLYYEYPKDYFLQHLFAFRPLKKNKFAAFWFTSPLIDMRQFWVKVGRRLKQLFTIENEYLKSFLVYFKSNNSA